MPERPLRSCWATFVCAKNPPRDLEAIIGKLWTEMRIEFVTSCRDEGGRFCVIAKTAIPHASTRWKWLGKALNHDEMEVCKASRYLNPLLSLQTNANSAELDANTIRTGSWTGPAIVPEPKRQKKPFLAFETEADAGLRKSLANEVSLKDLAQFPVLEAHRRVLLLEKYVCAGLSLPVGFRGHAEDSAELAWLAANRTKALTRSYLALDYLSVFVPAHCVKELAQDLEKSSKRRLQAAIRDAWPLVQYGQRLSALASSLGDRVAGQWSAYTFATLEWLPESFRRGFDRAAGWEATAETIAARVAKDREDVKQAAARRSDTHARTLSLLTEMARAGPGLLAGDSWDLMRTRDLPPTPSLPDAVCNVGRFLAPADAEQ